MDNAQVFALQCNRQCIEKALNAGTLQHIGGACKLAVFGLVAGQALLKVPACAIFGIVAQQVDFVIACNRAGVAAFNQALHQVHYAGAIGAAIYKVAYKYQRAVIGVLALFVIA